MAWWDFWRRRGAAAPPTDRVDGYQPQPFADRDPWSTPTIRQAIGTRRRRSREDSEAYDGFVNELTGIGSWQHDKTMGGNMLGPNFELTFVTGVEAEKRWRGHDLGGKIVEAIPDEMTREGWDITVQPTEEDAERDDDALAGLPALPANGPAGLAMPQPAMGPKPLPEVDDEGAEIAEQVDGKLEELGMDEVFWQALCYERAYGGAAILLGADDGMDLEEPLDEERLEDITHLSALTGGWDGEIVGWSYNNDIAGKNYGFPESYMVRNIGVPIARIPMPGERPPPPVFSGNPRDASGYGNTIRWVHSSRLLIFPGISASRRARVQMRGWGDSLFTRIDRVLREYDQTWGGVSNLMTDFSQGVLGVDGLLEALGGANKSTAVNNLTQRARTLQLTRSISRILLIDKTEQFTRDTASLAGISDVLQQFAMRLSGAADMPVELLFSQMLSGGLAKGDTTYRFFADRIRARQKRRMAPQLRRLVRLLFQCKDGPSGGKEPDRWTVKPRSLYQLNELERADLRLKTSQADDLDIKNQVISPEEAAASHYGGSEYSPEVTLDFDGRQEMAAQAERDRVVQQKLMAQQAKAALAAASAPKPEPANDPNPGEKPAEGGKEDGEWREEDHPRAENGKFGEGGGGGKKGGGQGGGGSAGGHSPELKQSLDHHERQLVDRTTEKVVVLDKDGGVVFTQDGDVNGTDLSPEQSAKTAGNVLTHNHPGGTSLSLGDVMRNNDASEIRAVSRQADGSIVAYVASRPEKGWPSKTSIDDKYSEAHSSVLERMREQPDTVPSFSSKAEARQWTSHQTWQIAAKELGISYRKEVLSKE